MTVAIGRRIAHDAASPVRGRLMPMGSALAMHALALVVLARVVVTPLISPPAPAGFAMVMTQVAPLSGAPLRPHLASPARLAVVSPLAITAGPLHVRPAHVVRPAPVAEVALASPAAPLAAPVAKALPLDTNALLPGLEDRIDQAVRRAAVLPAAAQRQHREGRARLRFTYQDGAVQDVQIVASSQSRLLDDAALAAVRDAAVPPAPVPLHGRRLDLMVWIDFRLGADG